MRRIAVDWTRIGRATAFAIPFPGDLDPGDLRVGDLVILFGDGVDDVQCVVTRLFDTMVRVRVERPRRPTAHLHGMNDTLYLPAMPSIPGGFGVGWVPLIQRLVDDLDLVAPGWEPAQVKNKFGTLSFYADPPEGAETRIVEAFRGRIRWTEQVSGIVCDVCGGGGSLREIRGWYSTRCDDHARRRPNPKLPDVHWPDAKITTREQ